jgi:hypothetical protein
MFITMPLPYGKIWSRLYDKKKKKAFSKRLLVEQLGAIVRVQTWPSASWFDVWPYS